MLLRRVAAPAALFAALAVAAPASAEMCEDCEPPPGSGGGSGSTLVTPATTLTGTVNELTWDSTPSFIYRSDLSGTRFRCSVTTGAMTSAWDCGTSAGDLNSASTTVDKLADGTHTFKVAACKDYSTATKCDASPAAFTFTVDTDKPQLTVDGSPEQPRLKQAPPLAISSTSSDVKEFQCMADGETSWSTCGPTFTWPAGLADGLHAVSIQAVDHAGNTSTQVYRSWWKDTVKPTGTLTGTSGLTNDRTPTWSWTASDADTELTATCSVLTPKGIAELGQCDGSWTPAQAFADGEHTFTVRIADRAGNVVELQRTATIDGTPPVIGDIFWDAELKRLKYDAADGALACRFDAGDEFACGTTVLADQLPDGEHTFTVRLTDAADNSSTKTKTFRIGAEPTQGGGDGDGSGDGAGSGDGSGAGGTPSTGGVSGGAWTPSGVSSPSLDGPTAPSGGPAIPSGAPLPTATPAAKKAAAKKRCRTVKKKVRGKTRKVRVCKKAKKNRRAAARRRA